MERYWRNPKFIRHRPEKPGLAGPALSRGLELQDVQRPFQSQQFCDRNEEWRINSTQARQPFWCSGDFFSEIQNELLGNEHTDNHLQNPKLWKVAFRRYPYFYAVEIHLGIHGGLLSNALKETTSTEFSGVLGLPSQDLTWFHSPVLSLCSQVCLETQFRVDW